MSTTVGDIINGALKLLGVLAEGETPSAATSQDSFTAFNQMLDSWSTERLAVYTTEEQVVSWPAGEVSRTFGPTGDIIGTRPIQVDSATYFVVDGVSYPVVLVNEAQYNGVSDKNIDTSYPQIMWARMDYPDITIKLYPVPSNVIELHIVSVKALAEATNLATELALPPGYLRALRYCLACEIAPEFGVEPSPTIQRIAMTSKRNLKRINSPGDLLSLPYHVGARRSRYDIFASNY
jgi:hypothetical protein